MSKLSDDLSIIVLAGGFGTRIRESIGDIPKILAPIQDKLFIDFFLEWIKPLSNIKNVKLIFSLFYKSNLVIKYLEEKSPNAHYLVDDKPYGTFGAVCNSAMKFPSENYLVLNGDTIFQNDFKKNYERFCLEPNIPLLILKKCSKNTRYGGYLRVNEKWIFSEDNLDAISMGAYFISRKELIRRWHIATSFDFLKRNLEIFNQKLLMNDKDCLCLDPVNGILLEEGVPFIDIGIKSSFIEAQKLIPSILND